MSNDQQQTQQQFNNYMRTTLGNKLESLREQSRSYERDQAANKLREAIMWLGEDSRLRRIDQEGDQS